MIAVDTNIISGFMRGVLALDQLPKDELFVPHMVTGELRAGVAAGGVSKEGTKLLEELLSSQHVTISPGLEPATVKCYAQIFAYLKKQGTPISQNDMWIAAECMQLALPLLTHDKDFEFVAQIILVSHVNKQ